MSSQKVCTHLETDPDIHPTAFVAPGADLMGAVQLGENSSVWYQCVLRADIERIIIGDGSNVQDGAVIHLASDQGTTVGEYVTVGHKAMLHACCVDNESLIGMGAIVMDGARVGARCIIGAGALIPPGKIIPPGSLVVGSPGRIVKTLPIDEQKGIRAWAEKYIRVAQEHREFLEKSGSV